MTDVKVLDDWPDGAKPVYRSKTERVAALCRDRSSKMVLVESYNDGKTASRMAGVFTKQAAQLGDGNYEFRADGNDVWGCHTEYVD